MSARENGPLPVLQAQAGPHACAVPLSAVDEIMRPLPIEPIPEIPVFVRGLSIVRGNPVPVIDLGLLMRRPEPGPCGRFVSLRVGDKHVALAVEEIIGLRALDPAALEELPLLLRAAPADAVNAIGVLDHQLLMVLEATRIVPARVWQSLATNQAAL
jgi:purine-binding chemotaxis protein CheW